MAGSWCHLATPYVDFWEDLSSNTIEVYTGLVQVSTLGCSRENGPDTVNKCYISTFDRVPEATSTAPVCISRTTPSRPTSEQGKVRLNMTGNTDTGNQLELQRSGTSHNRFSHDRYLKSSQMTELNNTVIPSEVSGGILMIKG